MQPKLNGSAIRRQSFLPALVLLAVAVAVNFYLQPNFFRPAVLSGNLRTYLPLALLAVAQVIVVIGGGIDLSLGAIVSLVVVVMVKAMGDNAETAPLGLAIALGLVTGLVAGLVNGVCVAYLRFQPLVTTFATSFVFAGAAIGVLPSPGGNVPAVMTDIYRANPLGVPLSIWVIALVGLAWWLVRSTRFGKFLFAVGGQSFSAYMTGVPVNQVRLFTYVIAGFVSALSAITVVMGTGTGDPLIGSPMTLGSVVAITLGGTRLSGGQGGMIGAVIGVLLLGIIRSIISFANVDTWSQTLVDGIIVMIALAGPGVIRAVRALRSNTL